MCSNKLLIVCIFAQLYLIHAEYLVTYKTPPTWRDIIINELDLVHTCSGECGSLGVIEYEPNIRRQNCSVVKDCKLSSTGWIDSQLYLCDYCNCKCEDSRPVVPEVIEVVEKKQFTEPALYGTCTGTCDNPGLVRTNWGGCNEVRDCKFQRDGWIRGFVMCDYCLCNCVREKLVDAYHLKNVRYNLDASDINPPRPTGLSPSIVQNNQDNTVSVNRWVRYEYTNTLSVETSQSLSTGIALTVEAGFGPITKFSTTAKIDAGFTSSTGKVQSETHVEEIHAEFSIEPHQQCEMLIIGQVTNLDIPFTAELVTTYDDGSTNTKDITGFFGGVETSEFKVNYHMCTDIEN